MSALPNTGISPALSNRSDTATRRLGELLDILIAIRIDVGHSANGLDASPALSPEEMRVVRVLFDDAIASAKEMFESAHHSATADVVPPFPHVIKAIPNRRMAELSQTPF
jgi:hypothetical protein